MGGQETAGTKSHICIGLLAHVDAGKTTLAESILYLTGSIRKPGRVDHGDAFLDTYALEKARGITIFSKQAEFKLGDRDVTLLDTPGHVDFSAEMERTLQVLDAAVLVISGADGVQGHVETLWRLLRRYDIPTFLFINKMDQPGTDRNGILRELEKKLSEHCLDFGQSLSDETFMESLAMCDEALLEKYLEEGRIGNADLASLIKERKVFPCYFGSALKIQGVEELLDGIGAYVSDREYPKEFGARVYKISRDGQNTRLTHMKVTGGTLKVKMPVEGEKADQIRIYSGASFRMVNEAPAGTICAVTGLEKTFSGQGLGIEETVLAPVLEPVLNYRIDLPEGSDVHAAFLKLLELEEEEPLLHIAWEEQLNEIHAQLMGEVQIEILKTMIRERFGMDVSFGAGNIVYKETIRQPVEGVGHFEPLRHYAEVHLLMEPGEPGSGLQFAVSCSEDLLDKNWQRLILTHLEEKKHRGVLTGAEITDMKITLAAGRAHLKHTEGGDFRQATYRAVRQGLKQAESVLLEPVYEYRLEIPAENLGRAIHDLQRMNGSFSAPETDGDTAVLHGTAPVACMQGYQAEVLSYTRGRGRLFCVLKGYEPCHNAAEIIAAAGYDAETDLENPTGSVFCAHGAGFTVPWDRVPEYMHLESVLKKTEDGPEQTDKDTGQRVVPGTAGALAGIPETGKRPAVRQDFYAMQADDRELETIFTRAYGAVERKRSGFGKTVRSGSAEVKKLSVQGVSHRPGGSGSADGRRRSTPLKEPEKEYLLVDGYNIIFAWEELKELAAKNIGGARGKLMDILSNYQGFRKCTVILVFDAYKVEGGVGEIFKYHNIHVVFTREAETADQYIEKTVHEIGKKYRVTVATSDGLEQVIIMGQGAGRMSAQDLKAAIEAANIEIREICNAKPGGGRNYLFDQLSDEMAGYVEEVRLGKKAYGEKNNLQNGGDGGGTAH